MAKTSRDFINLVATLLNRQRRLAFEINHREPDQTFDFSPTSSRSRANSTAQSISARALSRSPFQRTAWDRAHSSSTIQF